MKINVYNTEIVKFDIADQLNAIINNLIHILNIINDNNFIIVCFWLLESY